jgi:hypothetical protein
VALLYVVLLSHSKCDSAVQLTFTIEFLDASWRVIRIIWVSGKNLISF